MKFITPALISLSIFSGISLAAPAVESSSTTVSCKPTFSGKLFVTDLKNLTNTADTIQRGYNIELDTDFDENGNEFDYLGKQWSRGQSDFIFEKCNSKGSNQYGVINASSKQVITANSGIDQLSFNGAKYSGHILGVEDIGTSQNQLDKQWFKAEYKDDKSGGSYVTLTLTGKPNDKNHDYDLPNVAFGTSDKFKFDNLLATKSDTKYQLALFDVKKV
jgi:hypothetical protein